MQHSAELNDIIMSLDELVTACGQERAWVLALIEENIIVADASPYTNNETTVETSHDSQGSRQHFSGYQLSTLRRASRLSRDFDASVPAIGLILELLKEVEQLRQFKRQFDTQPCQVIEVKWE